MNISFDIFKTRVKLSLSFYRVRDTWTKGVLNRTKDGYYVFFLDYDMMRREYIEGELKRLQEVYSLGTIHLFQSSEKGFHAVAFCKFTAKEFVEIMNNSSCDSAFRNLPRFSTYRNWVLRNFEKGETDRPKYIKSYPATTNRQQSSAHHKWYLSLYPELEERELQSPDGETQIDWIVYATGGKK